MVVRWLALIIHTRTSAFAGMPPRRDARSPPRVQPQNDQAEEIRLIRDGLNRLEQKHDELQQKHAHLALLAWLLSLALSVLNNSLLCWLLTLCFFGGMYTVY